jgi:drug/metabolite transporter (DMT)-like permease
VLAISWVLLGEAVTWAHVLGALIVIAGVALATRRSGSVADAPERR